MRQKKRRRKINRCILKPTEEQMEAASQELVVWEKQHEPLIELGSASNMRRQTEGILVHDWITFVTEEAMQFAIENGKGRIFAVWKDIRFFQGSQRRLRVSWGAWDLGREQKLREGRTEIRLERKYLRWVRRHF
jgi:hypothetical protein